VDARDEDSADTLVYTLDSAAAQLFSIDFTDGIIRLSDRVSAVPYQLYLL